MNPVLILVAAAMLQEPTEGPTFNPASSPRPATRHEDPFLKAVGQVLSYPFRDNGRRFGAFPYADEGPYFLTTRLSQKSLAVMFETTYGRIEHDLICAGSEAMVSWSAGCDIRIDSIVFEEHVGRGTVETQLHHFHLGISTTLGPGTVDYSIGLGLSALEEEDSFDYGPSLRTSLRWFPARPFSLRFDAVGTWYGDETSADLRAGIGLHLHRFAITAGVRSVLRSDGNDFIGPTIGVAVYF